MQRQNGRAMLADQRSSTSTSPSLARCGFRFRSTEAEQRAIAAALSDVDALLGGLERLIAKKRDLKQAAMQQLLTGQTRLPGFHGEWEGETLGDVFSLARTDSNKAKEFFGYGTPIVNYMDGSGSSSDQRVTYQKGAVALLRSRTEEL